MGTKQESAFGTVSVDGMAGQEAGDRGVAGGLEGCDAAGGMTVSEVFPFAVAVP